MNAFTKAESALVDDIFREVTIYGRPKDSLLGLALYGVEKYARPCDQEAAAQAVIELVKERLNAIS